MNKMSNFRILKTIREILIQGAVLMVGYLGMCTKIELISEQYTY
jgi:hypothetical protein